MVKGRYKTAHVNYKAKKMNAKPHGVNSGKAVNKVNKPATKPTMNKSQKPVQKMTKGGAKPGGKAGGGIKSGKGGRK